MNPKIEILAVYIFVLAMPMLLVSLIPTHALASVPQTFSTPTSALLYVAYIAGAGVVLALAFKYKAKLMNLMQPIATFIKKNKRMLNYTGVGIGVIMIIDIAVYSPSSLLVLAVYIAVFLGGYYLIKRLLKNTHFSPKVAFVLLQIVVILVLGLEFTPLAALVFLIALAFYDFIAVFVTKHMLILANNLKNPLLMYQAVEFSPTDPSAINERVVAETKTKIATLKDSSSTYAIINKYGKYSPVEVKLDKKLKQKVIDTWKANKVPIINTMGLGGGDFMTAGIVVLTMFRTSLIAGTIFFDGAIIGLLITFAVSNKLKRPLPAIPLIGIGFAISLMVSMII